MGLKIVIILVYFPQKREREGVTCSLVIVLQLFQEKTNEVRFPLINSTLVIQLQGLPYSLSIAE